jgi:peptidoglycan/xylan/chitin deacetylase (PgdA/CDA1 family)
MGRARRENGSASRADVVTPVGSQYSRRVAVARGRQAVKLVAAGVDAFRRTSRGLVVLIYHRVGRRTSIETDLPIDLFADQVAFLVENTVLVTLNEGLQAIASPAPVASSMVAVTFDDGTADFADAALPVLARHRVPATLYVATAYVEHQRSFPHDGKPISWNALRDAQSTGLVSVGSHTHRHALLDRLPPSEVDDELDRSIGLIEERLGASPAHFAYPNALLGSPVAEGSVRTRFRSAALAGTRPNEYGSTDPYRLARSPVQMSDGMKWFVRKAFGGLELEDRVRRFINRHRHRHPGTR